MKSQCEVTVLSLNIMLVCAVSRGQQQRHAHYVEWTASEVHRKPRTGNAV